MVHKRIPLLTLTLVVTSILATALGAAAAAPGTPQFERTWERTDRPVMSFQADRTWMWGPEAITEVIEEPYLESPGGMRQVQYFDKSRMEINDPGAPDGIWYVTNGLLAMDLISGRVQLGDNKFEERSPANIPVAGDPDSVNTPTYATLQPFLSGPKHTESATITQVMDADGNITIDPDLVRYGIISQPTNVPTNHTIASVFWEFLVSEGIVYENGAYVRDQLFVDPMYLTGYPITEAFWVNAKVSGTEKLVLLQCFERRCLTYTPDNADGWRVEFGNIGQHYLTWFNQEQGALQGGILATFDVNGEAFNIWVTNPDTIEQILAIEAGTSQANIPIGPLEHGPGLADHNSPWSWHYDPELVEMAEITMELCDGAPWYVEENIDEFVDVVGSYCPWSAELQSVVDYR